MEFYRLANSRLLRILVGVAQIGQVCGQATSASSAPSSTSSTTSSVFSAPTGVPVPDVNSSTYDISQHYCRLWRHASVFADGKIYVDGGNTYLPKNNGTFSNTPAGSWTKGMNNQLLVIDLSKNFTNQDTSPFKSIRKGPGVPNALIEHALWYSRATRKVYQLGGWFSSNSQTDPGFTKTADIPSSAIWEFDLTTERWSLAQGFEPNNTGGKIDRPGAAANCDAPSLNISFIFEGYVQQRSDQAYVNYTVSRDFKYLSGMLSLDTSSSVSRPTLTNISVPVSLDGGKSPFGPRMNGAMVHVPVGSKGVVVQLGGQVTNENTRYGIRIPDANSKNGNVGLGFIDIYDIESGFWFRQRTFGLPNIPSGRSDICAVVVPARDNSSFNIYMVAGVETYSPVLATGEIWVLSLPSFQWILVHNRPAGIYGHTCHVLGENLIIVGGMQTKLEGGGDVDTCSDHMPAEIFSLAAHNYTDVFDAAGSTRHPPVPSQVVSAIGGTASGGAHIKSPQVWDDLYLQYVFNPSLTRPAYTPTYTLVDGSTVNGTDGGGGGGGGSGSGGQSGGGASSGDGSGDGGANNGSGAASNRNAIIGGAVGGVLGFLILAAIAGFCLLRRRWLRTAGAASSNRQSGQSELPAYDGDKGYGHMQQSQGELGVAPAYMSLSPGRPPVEMPVPQPAVSEVFGSEPMIPGHVGHQSISSSGDLLSPCTTVPTPIPQDQNQEQDQDRERVVSAVSPELGAWGGSDPTISRVVQFRRHR